MALREVEGSLLHRLLRQHRLYLEHLFVIARLEFVARIDGALAVGIAGLVEQQRVALREVRDLDSQRAVTGTTGLFPVEKNVGARRQRAHFEELGQVEETRAP